MKVNPVFCLLMLAVGGGTPNAAVRAAEPGSGAPSRVDSNGDPLPHGAMARIGTARFRHKSSILALSFSADGSMLATIDFDFVYLWQVSDGKKRLELKVNDYEHNSLHFVAISPDGKLLATVASGREDENTVHVWSTVKGDEKFKGDRKGGVESVAFSPDSKLLAWAGEPITLLDANTGEEIRKFDDRKSKATKLCFLPNAALSEKIIGAVWF